MNLDDVASAIADALDTIDGLRVLSEVPQSVNPPVAVVGMGAGTYETFDVLESVDFGVLVILSASNSKGSQRAIRAYCAATGSQSVKAALDTPDLQLAGVSTGAGVVVRSWDAPTVVTIAGTDYVGVEFRVSVVE